MMAGKNQAALAVCAQPKVIFPFNGLYTEWFDVKCGLKQGCSLSSVLFNLYINDLIQGITDLNIGIEIDGQKLVF